MRIETGWRVKCEESMTDRAASSAFQRFRIRLDIHGAGVFCGNIGAKMDKYWPEISSMTGEIFKKGKLQVLENTASKIALRLLPCVSKLPIR
jgi:hypothetical protein